MFFSFNFTHKYLDNRFSVEENLALQQCIKYADTQKLDFLNCTLNYHSLTTKESTMYF